MSYDSPTFTVVFSLYLFVCLSVGLFVSCRGPLIDVVSDLENPSLSQPDGIVLSAVAASQRYYYSFMRLRSPPTH